MISKKSRVHAMYSYKYESFRQFFVFLFFDDFFSLSLSRAISHL